MIGRRIYCNENQEYFENKELTKKIRKYSIGDFWKFKYFWFGLTPNGLLCNLSGHNIEENENGNITVKPSILVNNDKDTWHGFLENGVWK